MSALYIREIINGLRTHLSKSEEPDEWVLQQLDRLDARLPQSHDINELIDALQVFVPSPMCRDCADHAGSCPNASGKPCDPEEAKEWARGIRDKWVRGYAGR